MKYFIKKAGCRFVSYLIPRSNPVIMKLDTPEFKSIFTLELMTLASIFKNHNFELRIAGGAVRDLLLGKKPKDFDFATTATPEQMKEMFNKENIRMINMNGEKHGTITPRINNKENFEITTLRIDKITDGRHAEVEFTKDWLLDASRRDLTINSMFLGLDGTLYDFFHGYDDLKKRRVVFVGDATIRIKEDYLRILRYFRFYGRIADNPDSHDKETLEAIKANVKGLDQISGERIWSELQKILTGNFFGELVVTMLKVGIGPHIGLPEEPNIRDFEEIYHRTYKIKTHPVTRLIALVSNEKEFLKLNSRLKMSAFERDMGLFILQYRNETLTLKRCQWLCVIGKQKHKVSDLKEWVVELLKYTDGTVFIEEFRKWELPRFPLSGAVLKDHGVPGGKIVGEVLMKLKEYWAVSDFSMTPKELLDLLPQILREMGIESKFQNYPNRFS